MSERSGAHGTVFRTAVGLVRGREADVGGLVAAPGIPYAAPLFAL